MRPLVLTLLLAPCLLLADEASKRAKIQEYFQLSEVQRTMEQSVDQVMAAMRNGFMQQLEDVRLTTDQNKVIELFHSRVGKIVKDAISWEKIKDEYTDLFAKNFTEEEIEGMNVFYRSPAGKAMIQKLPILMQRGSELGQRRMQAAMPDLQRAITELTDEVRNSKPAPAKKP